MIGRKELIDTLLIAVDQALANLHTATIAKITKVGAKTIDCKPVINRVVNGTSIELPEFVDVPPVFMQGGGSYIATPISEGDYCLLLIMERCFDRWYDGDDFQPPLEARMHDYSDAIAIVGVNPAGSAITIPGLIHIEGNSKIVGNLTVEGNIVATGEVTAKEGVNEVNLSTHRHTGNLGASTSPPTPGT